MVQQAGSDPLFIAKYTQPAVETVNAIMCITQRISLWWLGWFLNAIVDDKNRTGLHKTGTISFGYDSTALPLGSFSALILPSVPDHECGIGF